MVGQAAPFRRSILDTSRMISVVNLLIHDHLDQTLSSTTNGTIGDHEYCLLNLYLTQTTQLVHQKGAHWSELCKNKRYWCHTCSGSFVYQKVSFSAFLWILNQSLYPGRYPQITSSFSVNKQTHFVSSKQFITVSKCLHTKRSVLNLISLSQRRIR